MGLQSELENILKITNKFYSDSYEPCCYFYLNLFVEDSLHRPSELVSNNLMLFDTKFGRKHCGNKPN